MVATSLLILLLLAAFGLVVFVALFVVVYAAASSSSRRSRPRAHVHRPQHVHHEPSAPPQPRPRPSSTLGTWVAVGFAAVVAMVLLPVVGFIFLAVPARTAIEPRATRVAEAPPPLRRHDDATPVSLGRDGPPVVKSEGSTRQRTVTRNVTPEVGDEVVRQTRPAAVKSGREARRSKDPELVVQLADPLEAWEESSVFSGDSPKLDRDRLWVLNAAGSRQDQLRDDDVVSITARRPGPGGQLVGYSAWNASPEDAQAEALESATDQLGAVLLSELAERASEDPRFDLRRLDLDLAELPRIVEARIGTALDPFIRDRFSESVQKSYGTLHRAAVLIRVPDDAVARLTDELVRDVQVANLRVVKGRHERLWTALAAIGMALVAFLLYSFFNAGTKGYFAWPLRIISLTTLAVLYAALFLLRGWIS